MIYDTFGKAGLQPDREAVSRFLRYHDLLVDRNRHVNLTAITEFPEVVTKHFLDSCMPLCDRPEIFAAPEGGSLSVADVGTGAGFPGLPIGIMRPDIRLTLIDSLRKRVDFLRETVEALGLSDVKCLHFRAEDAGREEDLREQFDVAVSRAVARLSVLLEYVLPFVKEGGVFIAYKAGEPDEEIREAENALSVLGGKVERVSGFTLPGTDHERSLIYIRKVAGTPAKYPRKAGKPEKNPL